MNTTKARIDRLTAEAVAFIRRAEPLTLKMDARGIHVAFSGGKEESQERLAEFSPLRRKSVPTGDKDIEDARLLRRLP